MSWEHPRPLVGQLHVCAAAVRSGTGPSDELACFHPAASGQGWVEDFSPGAVKGIGTAEILGALGLVLPALLNIATVLVPAAAAGLFMLMAGAAATHARRREVPNVVVNIVLGLLAAGVAVARFGPYSF